ncbi:zinc finger protein 431-like [Galleria mellonella]|uniref:Zinc finger protein 431-like n=1 Tax=Galleria mellonella TaxID=7137 RepID=A0A6J3CGJ3_GALME|nr:zinc finger protein 431-like [Galleria mellonella]
MSENEIIYCRFCAETANSLQYIDLSIDSQTRSSVVEKLAVLNLNEVDFRDKTLPETICLSCYDIFKVSYEFFTKIKLSQVVLKERGNFFTSEATVFVKDENGENEVKSQEISFNNDYDTNCYIEDDKCDTEIEKCNVSWASYGVSCKFCGVDYSSVTELREHCKETHSTCCGFQCSDCHSNFEDFTTFVEHVREHRKELIDYCQHCNMKINQIDHTKTHILQPNCQFCGEIFQNEISLTNHHNLYQNLPKKLSKHKISELKELLSYGLEIYEVDKLEIVLWKDYIWICQYCSTRFSNQDVLRCHVKNVHGKCFGNKCIDCDEICKSFDGFIEHVRLHRPLLRYCCQYCNAKFDDQQLTIIHTNTHLQSFQCETCGESFNSKFDLQRHLTAYGKKTKRIPFKSREKPISIEDLTCDICRKVTKSLSNLRAHRVLHTDRNRDYTCDRCGKTFFTKGALYTHSFIHQNVEPQVCKVCKKTFLTLSRLKKHIKTHYEDKPFECNLCFKRFRLKDHLKGHMITHTDLLPYSCQYCNKGFRHKNVLKTHENLHTGAKPFSCTVCGMEFANWSNCNKHMKRKHGATLAKNVLTPQGKVPINQKTGKPKKIKDLETVREWTEQILVPCKRGKKSGQEKGYDVVDLEAMGGKL